MTRMRRRLLRPEEKLAQRKKKNGRLAVVVSLFLAGSSVAVWKTQPLGMDPKDMSLLALGNTLNESSEGGHDVDHPQSQNSLLSILAGEGTISCKDAFDKVEAGEWHDPNEGYLYARRTVNPPYFKISVHNHSYDWVRWNHIYLNGKYYEDEVNDRFLELLKDKPKSLVVDIGANIGYYTLLSVALGHDVMSFEINPANILRLCESIRLNDWKERVAIFQKGVSEVHKEKKHILVPRNPGQAFMRSLNYPVDTNETSAWHSYTETVTLDEFARERGWFDKNVTISVLKLDVEGKESFIIEGSKRLLKSGMVQNILTELTRIQRGTVREALATLLEAGYDLRHDKVTVQRSGNSTVDANKLVEDLVETFPGRKGSRKALGRPVDLWFRKGSG